MSIFRKKHELYRISDDSVTFHITNANKMIAHQGIVYEPASISRTSINLKTEMEKLKVDITLSADHPLSVRHINTIVESNVTLSIFEDYNGEFLNLWRGRLIGVKLSDDGNEVDFSFESGYTRLLKSGATRKYQRTCPYALYSKECGVKKENYRGDVFINSQTGRSLNVAVATRDSNDFVGGMIEIPGYTFRYIVDSQKLADVEMQKTTIVSYVEIPENTTEMVKNTDTSTEYNGIVKTRSYSSNVPYDESLVGTSTTRESQFVGSFYRLVLFSGFNEPVNGVAGDIYPGCKKTSTWCRVKFNNISNFGGFPFMPRENPFESGI